MRRKLLDRLDAEACALGGVIGIGSGLIIALLISVLLSFGLWWAKIHWQWDFSTIGVWFGGLATAAAFLWSAHQSKKQYEKLSNYDDIKRIKILEEDFKLSYHFFIGNLNLINSMLETLWKQVAEGSDYKESVKKNGQKSLDERLVYLKSEFYRYHDSYTSKKNDLSGNSVRLEIYGSKVCEFFHSNLVKINEYLDELECLFIELKEQLNNNTRAQEKNYLNIEITINKITKHIRNIPTYFSNDISLIA